MSRTAITPFAGFIAEQLSPLGPVGCRPMFGAIGLFLDGRMFGIVTREDALFIKADAATADRFRAAGFPPFTYTAKGRPRSLAYHRLDAEAVSDEARLLGWARLGLEAARRPPRRRGRDLPDSDDPVLGMLRVSPAGRPSGARGSGSR